MPRFPGPPPLPRVYCSRDYTTAQFRALVADLGLVRVGWGGYIVAPTGPRWEQDNQRALGAIVSMRGRLAPDTAIWGPSAGLLHGCWLGESPGESGVRVGAGLARLTPADLSVPGSRWRATVLPRPRVGAGGPGLGSA
ncbi:MAG: hypothetical protein V9G19_04125 [Tetrasphaera sp.]